VPIHDGRPAAASPLLGDAYKDLCTMSASGSNSEVEADDREVGFAPISGNA